VWSIVGRRTRDTMAIDPLPLRRPDPFRLARPLELTCFALCVAQAVFLAASFVHGLWLVNPAGQPFATDFVNVWAAGRTALDGDPAAVYDVLLHKAAEDAALGHAFEGKLPWNYPPIFLLVAALLALLPYIAAHAVWMSVTFPAYLWAMRAIIGHRVGILLACAYPGVLPNLIVGQNGFLTAALLGGSLVTMQRRPLLAGCLLGLLAFKPHFGILFPLVLVAGSRWRVIAAAATTVLLLGVLSVLAFGWGAWEAFFHALPVISQATLTEGRGDFAKIQSTFTFIRWLGGTESQAWAVHGTLIAVTALLLCVLWRSRVAFEMKAAALATGALLATPYLYLYDLVTLAVPMAFLLRAGMQGGFLPGEIAALGLACLIVLSFLVVPAPVGLAAILVVAALVIRRVLVQYGVLAAEPDCANGRKGALI
jgi:arabinofuranan 3-O-arabinosyltransferase